MVGVSGINLKHFGTHNHHNTGVNIGVEDGSKRVLLGVSGPVINIDNACPRL